LNYPIEFFNGEKDTKFNFKQLSDDYNSYETHRGCYNGSIGKIYNLRENVVNHVGCNHWNCPRCRKRLRWNLYEQTFYLSKSLGLDKHFIITFGGKEFRTKYTYEESYGIMSNYWDKYKKVIEYHKGKFDYIQFARAQQDGYCHLHTIIPKFISWKFLDEKRKLYDKMGFVSINKNVDLADYLSYDFFKDREYYIPKGVRHYNSSRALTLNRFDNPFFQDDNVMVLGRHTVEKFEDDVLGKFGRLLPNEYYIREYYQ